MQTLKQKIHYWCPDTTSGTITGKGVCVAILDTGMALHPDLKYRIVGWKDMVQKKRSPYDDNGHGTHVAGILAGDGRSSHRMMVGMAPRADLIAVKVLNQKGDGRISDVIGGIQYILREQKRYKIRVVNISIGTAPHAGNEDEKKLVYWVDRLWDAGMVVITAAGNMGPGEGSITLPGNSKKVITVGSCLKNTSEVQQEKSAFSYSGCGPTGECIAKPDVTAPGTGIYSCNYRYPYQSNMPYLKKSGTSMATPVVSGCTALLLEKYPDMKNVEVKMHLWESCEDLGFPQNKQGHGLIHVGKLLQ